MELFVINRYRDDNVDVDKTDQEHLRLLKLKKYIEDKKKQNAKNSFKSTPEVIILRPADNLSESQPISNGVTESDKSGPEIDVNLIKAKEKKKSSQEFKVLGTSDFEKKAKVHRILPYWLSHPYRISTKLQGLSCKVDNQNWLHNTLKTTLKSENVVHLFPVQEEVIPFILQEHKAPFPLLPHDICVSAPTGSGKTLSFVLPIIQILMNEVGCHIRALIVLPVQELATQVAKVFKKYCTKTGLKVALLSGATPLYQEQQQIVRYTDSAGFVSEVDIIVCTAGRLVEHLHNTDGFSLKHLKFLVIDEADRIMDHIQNDWLYHLDRHIKLEDQLMTGKVPNLSWNSLLKHRSPPHKLLFSATLSQDPEKLEKWGLFQPKLFSSGKVNDYEDEDQIRKYTTPDELKESYVTCTAEEKPLVMYNFLVEQKWDKVLCFTNAAQSVHRLAVLLDIWGKGQFKVAELSAALDRTTRETVLKEFTQSEINVLIVTDAMARGIDIPDCRYVISYDPPRNIKTYIHRVGRTGRAGQEGHAVTILQQNQLNLFKEIIQFGGKAELPEIKIETNILEKFTESYENAIQKTKQIIHNEINSKVKKSIELKRGSKSKAQKRKHNSA